MSIKGQKEIDRWFLAGRPSPPPHAIKVRNILSLADLFNLSVMVETGTFHGQMIDATIHRFKQIHSIEIFEPLAMRAIHRFKGNPKVQILYGDSSDLLPSLLSKIPEPILFWLDGHFSGEGTGIGRAASPIVAEIEHILRLRQQFEDVIIIDDARCFAGTNGYPELNSFMADLKKQFGRHVRIADDAIFILPS
jgi:hypothetical protein